MSKTTRLLSLILVIAMAFSLVVSGASAAWADDASSYPDYATVNYQEAAQVLTYINIINGVADGDEINVNPEGNLQRDAAAKIVTLLITAAGDKTADSVDVTPTNTEFTDVPKTQWASGYIQWAYKNNIVNGKGNGEYRPTETVTVLQFLKMLLTGLGWGANGEFTGSGWDSATYVKASELGLWGDVEPVMEDRVCTREEAMEFALMALTQTPVHYGFDAYAIGSGLSTTLSALNANDTYPLYIKHGLVINERVDEIGYLFYDWTDKATAEVIYRYEVPATKTVVLGSSTKAADILGKLSGAYIDDGCFWINGLDNIYSNANGNAFETAKEFTDFFINPKTSKVDTGFVGAKVTMYAGDGRSTHTDYSSTHTGVIGGGGNIEHAVVEIQFPAEVVAVGSAKKTYNLKLLADYKDTTNYDGGRKLYDGAGPSKVGDIDSYGYNDYAWGTDASKFTFLWDGKAYASKYVRDWEINKKAVRSGLYNEQGLVFNGFENPAENGYTGGEIVTVVPKFKWSTASELTSWITLPLSYNSAGVATSFHAIIAAGGKDNMLKVAGTNVASGYGGYTGKLPYIWKFNNVNTDENATWSFTNNNPNAYVTGTWTPGSYGAPNQYVESLAAINGTFYLDENGFAVWYVATKTAYPTKFALSPVAHDATGLRLDGNYAIDYNAMFFATTLVGDFMLYEYNDNLQGPSSSEGTSALSDPGFSTMYVPGYDNRKLISLKGKTGVYGTFDKTKAYWDYDKEGTLVMTAYTATNETAGTWAVAYDGTWEMGAFGIGPTGPFAGKYWEVSDSVNAVGAIAVYTNSTKKTSDGKAETPVLYSIDANALLAINDVIQNDTANNKMRHNFLKGLTSETYSEIYVYLTGKNKIGAIWALGTNDTKQITALGTLDVLYSFFFGANGPLGPLSASGAGYAKPGGGTEKVQVLGGNGVSTAAPDWNYNASTYVWSKGPYTITKSAAVTGGRATGNTGVFDLTLTANVGFEFYPGTVDGDQGARAVMNLLAPWLVVSNGFNASADFAASVPSGLIDLSSSNSYGQLDPADGTVTAGDANVYVEFLSSTAREATFRVYYYVSGGIAAPATPLVPGDLDLAVRNGISATVTVDEDTNTTYVKLTGSPTVPLGLADVYTMSSSYTGSFGGFTPSATDKFSIVKATLFTDATTADYLASKHVNAAYNYIKANGGFSTVNEWSGGALYKGKSSAAAARAIAADEITGNDPMDIIIWNGDPTGIVTYDWTYVANAGIYTTSYTHHYVIDFSEVIWN